MKLYGFFLVFGFSIIHLSAQTKSASKELKNINENYRLLKSWSSQIIYKSFAVGDKNALDVKIASYSKDTKGYVYSIGGIGIISSEKYMLNIIPERRTLVISKSNSTKNENPFSGLNLDSLMDHNTKSIVKKETDSTSQLSVTLSENVSNTIKSIDLSYTSDTYYIKRIIVNYKEQTYKLNSKQKSPGTKLELTFKNFKKSSGIHWVDFDLRNIVEKVKGKYQGKGIFRGYKIIDNRIK